MVKHYLILSSIVFIFLISCHSSKDVSFGREKVLNEHLAPDNAIIYGSVTELDSNKAIITFSVQAIRSRGSSFHAIIKPGDFITLRYVPSRQKLKKDKIYTIEISAHEVLGGKYSYEIVRIINK